MDEDADDLDFNKEDLEKIEEREKHEHFQLLRLLDRDNQARKLALEAGNKASKDALKQGHYTSEDIAEIAKAEMIRALKDFKPAHVTVERALDNVTKIRD